MAYDEEQLGRYLVREAYVVSGTATVGNLLVELKTQELPPYTDSFLVTDAAGRYLGQVDLNMLLGSPRGARLRDIADSLDEVLTTDMPLLEASNRVKNSGRSMLPVLDSGGQLLGRFSLRDALDVFQEHFEAQIMLKTYGHLRYLRSQITSFLQYLLLTEEVALTAPISGNPDYEKWFEAQGPFDSKGRSLRQLDSVDVSSMA